MGKWLTKRAAFVGAALIVGLSAVVVLAQPVIAEMKLRFFDSYLTVNYDSNPNTVGMTKILEVDGADAIVTVNGELNVTGAVGTYWTDTFDQGDEGAEATLQLDGTVADLSTGVYNMFYGANGTKILFASLGAGQTLNLDMTATGLDITGDATDTEGYELILGQLGASSRTFVIGEDPAFYTCATLAIADVSDAVELGVGFRRPEVINATWDNYLDGAWIGFNSEVNPAQYATTTQNDDTTVDTELTGDTMADADEDRLCVFVSAAGVVTYTIDGVAPASAVAFTFDDGDPVVPNIRHLHGTSSASGIVITEWTVGYTAAGVNP